MNRMTTAQEMMEYCEENEMGFGASKRWSRRHFRLIEQALGDDEFALVSFIALHNYKTLLLNEHHYAYAFTNKRIIIAHQKIIGRKVQIITYENLNDVTLNTRLIIGLITVDSIRETFNVGTWKSGAVNINHEIQQALLRIEKMNKTQQETDAAYEIWRYKQLLDSGAITWQEYEMMKKKLLGL